MLDTPDQWHKELVGISSELGKALFYLKRDDTFPLERALLFGATVSRSLFEHSKEAVASINKGGQHFNPQLACRINRIGESTLDLHGSIGELWSLDQTFTISKRTLCNQIIHVHALQFWKSPNVNDPSFFIGSKDALKNKKRFYHVHWSQFQVVIDEIASAMIKTK